VFVSIKGSSYARFRRALEVGRLPIVYAAAAELPRIDLLDALEILALIAEQDPERYPRAAGRWIGRFALERGPAGIGEVRMALAACELLPSHPAEALGVLRRLAG
jgi:hypothetical protein